MPVRTTLMPGKRDERPIFLRNDLRPEVTEQDVRNLAGQEPVVLSITALDNPPVAAGPLRERAREANRVLVTDVVSPADMATPFDTPRSALHGQAGAPLLRLVQPNLPKGGRGLLTPHDVERLAQSATPPESGAALTEQFPVTFQETADEMFAPDAALRLRRSAELLRLGLSTEVIDAIAGATGELSEVELRVLIPYLLADETARANTRLWRYIGSMMSLERLEELGDARTCWPTSGRGRRGSIRTAGFRERGTGRCGSTRRAWRPVGCTHPGRSPACRPLDVLSRR
jgi:hypothetical protein